MAREVESVHTFERDPKFGLAKEKTVVRCDDGATYEFEEADGSPVPRLVRGFQPDGSMTHVSGSAALPGAVKETANLLFEGWSK